MRPQRSWPQGAHESPDLRARDLPDLLAAIARRIARLGYGCRDAEAFVVAKLTLAAEVRKLAREART